jgi:hypothetical protein
MRKPAKTFEDFTAMAEGASVFTCGLSFIHGVSEV